MDDEEKIIMMKKRKPCGVMKRNLWLKEKRWMG